MARTKTEVISANFDPYLYAPRSGKCANIPSSKGFTRRNSPWLDDTTALKKKPSSAISQ